MHGVHGLPNMHGMSQGPTSGLLQGISPEHVPALLAPLLVPVAIWLFLKGARAAAAHGFVPAERFLRGYAASSPATRTAAVLLLVTAFIHLGLVPGHMQEAPALARLFFVNGVLFVGAAIACFTVSWWRPAAAVLLVLTLLAYLSAVGKGTEDVDQLGIATKLVELAALGLVLVPSRNAVHSLGSALRRTAAAGALIFATVVVGAGIWGAELKPHNAAAAAAVQQDEHGSIGHGHEGHDPTGMVMQSVPSTPPTPAQRAAAAKLAADTKAGTARYQNVAVALADGYRPTTATNQPLVHYGNPKYMHDGRILDPARPEELVYANTAHGPVLLGAMYMTEQAVRPGPDIGGSLTQWHAHANICFAANAAIAGFLTPFGTCPAGTINVLTPAMLHVWTIDNPTGAYGELDPAFVAHLVHS